MLSLPSSKDSSAPTYIAIPLGVKNRYLTKRKKNEDSEDFEIFSPSQDDDDDQDTSKAQMPTLHVLVSKVDVCQYWVTEKI